AQMTFALDAAFAAAVRDDAIHVIVLAGAGDHFSAGDDIGSPGRGIPKTFSRVAPPRGGDEGKARAEKNFLREREGDPGMCRRWRELPKPTIAMVQGACIAGGLMLAWICDLIVASEDAFFADPVLKMGIPGVEYFAHPYALPPRVARELLFTGDQMSARRAYELGMVNLVVPLASLEAEPLALADPVASLPPLAPPL